MARCDACGRDWSDDFERCPVDGTPLGVALSAEQAGAVSASLGGAVPSVRLPAPGASSLGHAVTEELSIGTVVGEYRVECTLGEGGMGCVYGAVHPIIGKRAAIKVVHRVDSRSPEVVGRFVQEARAVNQIRHPNIVDVFSFGVLPDGRPYLVMEWLEGESLSRRLQRERLAPLEAIEILDYVCRALAAAHEKGIIHRDLKPDNVFLVNVPGEGQLVKLLDFGLAKLAIPADPRAEQTRSGHMLGTPLYISPEQARGRHVDHRTDIYALGAMAFELFCGRPPFVADSVVEILSMHLDKSPPPPRSFWPEMPPALEELILAMLAKEPDNRPPLEEVRSLFDAVHQRLLVEAARQPGGGEGARVRPPVVPTAEVRRATAPAVALAQRRSRGGLLLGLVAAALVLGGGALAWWRWGGVPAAAPAVAGPAAVAPAPASPSLPPPPTPAPASAPAVALPAAPAAHLPTKPAPASPPAAGTLEVRVDVPNATITLDGVVVARATDAVRVPVKRAGAHTLVATAPGRRRHKRRVVVAAGASVEVLFHLAPSGASRAHHRRHVGARAGSGETPTKAPVIRPAPPKAPPSPPRRDDGDGTIDPFKKH